MKRVIANPTCFRVKISDMLSNLNDDPTDKQIAKYANALTIIKATKGEYAKGL
jgi:hypothetical protein